MIKSAKIKILNNFAPLSFTLAIIAVYIIGEEITEYIVFYGIYILGTLIYLYFFQREILKSTFLFLIPFIVFVLYFLLSLIWTRSSDETSFAGDRERFYATLGFVIVTTSIFSISDRIQEKLSHVIAIVSSIGAIVTLVFHYVPGATIYRLTVSDYNENVSAFIFSLSSIFALYISMAGKKYLFLIPYILMSYVVFLTRGRGAILSLIIVSLIVLLFEYRSDKGWILRLALILAIGAFIAFVAGFVFSDVLTEFIARADNYRIEIWIHSAKRIMAYPLLGYGADAEYESTILPGMFPAHHPHNLILGVLFYGGLVGLMLFAWTYKGVVLGLVEFRHEAHVRLPIYLLLFFLAMTTVDTGRPLQKGGPDVFFYWLPYCWAAGWILSRRREQAR